MLIFIYGVRFCCSVTKSNIISVQSWEMNSRKWNFVLIVEPQFFKHLCSFYICYFQDQGRKSLNVFFMQAAVSLNLSLENDV